MQNNEAGQSKNTAIELIKKFQQLFTDLNHKQIAERLVKLVIAKETISRAVLIVERDSHLYVEAIASAGANKPFVNGVATSLSRLNYLPHQYIHQVFEERKPGTIPEVRAAVLEAGKKRVRPAMMTAATAIIALLPVLSSTGKGADLMVPMAIPTFGGMTIQIMTMFVVPVLQAFWRETTIKMKNK